jgi:hypothetical protein
VSFEHLDAAAQLEGLPPAPKSVLVHVAQHACVTCGLAWPGVPLLERKTGLGRTAIKLGLEWLVNAGHLKIHAYPHGGRGMATEYIVLPSITGLSTAPCGECRQRMKRGRLAAGIDERVTEKPAARRPVTAKPAVSGVENRPLGGPQSVIESESVTRVRAKPVETSPSAPLTPSDPNPPLSASENARRAGELARALGDTIGPPSSRDAKPGGPEAH